MSYSTIGAILTGVGAVCQLVASGFTQQIDVIRTKKTDSVEELKTRLGNNNNKPQYVRFEGQIDAEEPITAPLSRQEAVWCWSENVTNNGLIEPTILSAKDVQLTPTSNTTTTQGIKLKPNRYFEHHMTPLMKYTVPFSAPYYQWEKILPRSTKVFMIGHVKQNKDGQLTLLWRYPSYNIFKSWTQPTIIDSDPEQRVSQLHREADLWQKAALVLVSAGVGTLIYDNTK